MARWGDLEVCLKHVGGFRDEPYFSLLEWNRIYRGRLPIELVWILGDLGGNPICLGTRGSSYGKVFYWLHDDEPEQGSWSGTLADAPNVIHLADSFDQFVEAIVLDA